MDVIVDKKQMYELLTAGKLGNTLPQFFSVEEWRDSGLVDKFAWWGVRTLVPLGPCRLNCPTSEVEETARRPEFVAAGVNISIMVDRICRVTLWAEIQELPQLYLYGIEHPPQDASWRKLMPTQGRGYEGLQARMLLQKHLNPNALDDLEILLARYPGHVIEFSCVDRCFGCHDLRNMIVWEVRKY